MVGQSVGQSVIYSVGQCIIPYVCWSFVMSCISLGQEVTWSGRLHGQSVTCSVSCLVSGWVGWCVVWLLVCLVG